MECLVDWVCNVFILERGLWKGIKIIVLYKKENNTDLLQGKRKVQNKRSQKGQTLQRYKCNVEKNK